MVEVFKTNVQNSVQAKKLIRLIHLTTGDCKANFDLEDCDRILRIASRRSKIYQDGIIKLLAECGFHAEPLGNEVAV